MTPPGGAQVRRIVVDTDTGIDDALALVVLASRPDVELVAVGTTHGNCTTEQATAKRPPPGGAHGDPTLGVGDPNTFHDAEAARLVAAAPGDVTLVGVDVTMGCAVRGSLLDRVDRPTTEHGRLAADIVQRYVGAYEQRYGTRCLALHDPLAAMVALDLDVGATFRHGPTAVVGPGGEERVVLDAGGAAPSRRVLASVDGDRAVGHLLTAPEQPLPGRMRG